MNSSKEYPSELLRVCPYCGDMFIANHGLRQFCESKHGRANFCKHQYKALLNEKRLANLNLLTSPIEFGDIAPLKWNERILKDILGNVGEKVVSNDHLKAKGYRFDQYFFKFPETKKRGYAVYIGDFKIEEIGQNESFSTFRVRRS